MTFTPITSRKKSSLAGDAAIGLSGRKNFNLDIALRVAVLPEAFKGGALLEVALGSGEDYGRLRLTAAGLRVFPLKPPPRSKEIVVLKVPLPGGVDPEPHDRETVECSRRGDEVFLKLPVWARPKQSITSAPAARSVTAAIMGDPPPNRSAAARGRR